MQKRTLILEVSVLDDGQILCTYEAGEEHAYERIELVRMTLAELSAVTE
jgi:coenzyme F420-reducing hydrogenase delta subunit